MMNFFTSESGTVTNRAGLSFAWIVVALVAVTVLAAVPAQANSCVPPEQCYWLACGESTSVGCVTYGGCAPWWRAELYMNSPYAGCQWIGYTCISC